MKCNSVIFVVGTNASGKSELGLHLAEKFNGEIVSADSRQVFRRLDLGSGKLRPDQMRGIPHHMIDIIEPGGDYSLYEYQCGAFEAIRTIHQAGKVPFIVGGTGLYVNSILEGYVLVPVGINRELRTELSERPLAELLSMVRAEQPEALPYLQNASKRRVLRAIEVIRGGVRYEETRRKEKRFRCLVLGISYAQEDLYHRIRTRLLRRIDEGMITEVQRLLEQGISERFLYDMGLEYRSVLLYLRGEFGTREEFVADLERGIRQFAKRQLTWFRRNKEILWISGGDSAKEEASTYVERFLSAIAHTPRRA